MWLDHIDRQKLLAIFQEAWPDAYLDETGEVLIPIRISLSDEDAPIRSEPKPRPRPSIEDLGQRVKDAQATITFNGGTATRAPTKRQHFDQLSYAYGLLWGAASALDIPLQELIERYGSPKPRRGAKRDA